MKLRLIGLVFAVMGLNACAGGGTAQENSLAAQGNLETVLKKLGDCRGIPAGGVSDLVKKIGESCTTTEMASLTEVYQCVLDGVTCPTKASLGSLADSCQKKSSPVSDKCEKATSEDSSVDQPAIAQPAANEDLKTEVEKIAAEFIECLAAGPQETGPEATEKSATFSLNGACMSSDLERFLQIFKCYKNADYCQRLIKNDSSADEVGKECDATMEGITADCQTSFARQGF